MKHIVEFFDENIIQSALWDFYFKDLRVGVLDIETTGLDRNRNKFILGGLYNSAAKELHQVLAENRPEERLALEEFANEMSQVDMVVTYNGRHFDMPFIERRWQLAKGTGSGETAGSMASSETGSSILSETCSKVAAGTGAKLVMPYNLDLYLILSGHSPIKKLVPNMRQKTIENYMGFWDKRSDEISGAESVELYNHYEATGDKSAEEKILLHNNDDIRQLTRLTATITKSDFHKAMFCLGFPVGPFTVQKIRLQRDYLQVSGMQRPGARGLEEGALDYRGFIFRDQPVESMFQRTDQRPQGGREGWFELQIPIIRDRGLAIADLQSFGIQDQEEEGDDPFRIYPRSESGFLVLGDAQGISHMETNHFVKSFLGKFAEEELNIPGC